LKLISGGIFDKDNLNKKIKELELKTAEPGFWDDPKQAANINKKISDLQYKLESFDNLIKLCEDIETSLEIVEEEYDDELFKEACNKLETLNKKVDIIEIQSLFSGEMSSNNAILNIHPGAGGTESHDWAQMLYRMYNRWCEINGFKITVLDWTPGEEAGLKNVTILVKGQYAYGYLQTEKGIHRLVRISPFDSNSRRHTSFASVEVMPEVDDNIEIDIKPEDIKIDTYRASGAGGQHVNTTDSAVRITHIPSGISVQCQNDRSQHQNKNNAMLILKSRLYEKKIEEQKKEIKELSGEKSDIAWGHQIRSYVFHPYNMVKDHRTNYEVGNVQSVMDGNINDFIYSYLKSRVNNEE
jgi:peptide chain release factor 2